MSWREWKRGKEKEDGKKKGMEVVMGETLHEREVNVSTWALQACGQIGNPTGPIVWCEV